MLKVSNEYNSTECDWFMTYLVNNGLEVIRRLTSWLIFCRGYDGSTSREGGYFNNNGVYRHAAGMSRLFDLSNLLLGGIQFRLQYINISI
jgi:hypothetical protein